MDIVYRAAIIFLFLWMVTRVVGRSAIGELSTFQLILFITMGDMVQQAVTQQDYSMTAGILAVSTFAVLTIALSWASVRWPRLQRLTHGVPVIILQGGKPIARSMRRERLGIDADPGTRSPALACAVAVTGSFAASFSGLQYPSPGYPAEENHGVTPGRTTA